MSGRKIARASTGPAADFLRLHHFLPTSRANGPGTRAVIWVQGCTLGCPGCFNGPTHPATGGEVVSVDTLFERIASIQGSIEGLTISGGEPLQQGAAVARLLRRVKSETNLSVILFSGFSWAELERMGAKERRHEVENLPLGLLQHVDVLIAGRYDQTQHLARDLRGSANKKTYFLTDRYTEADMQAIPPAEVVITASGEVIMSGIDPLKW
jgi:anaerobic ribonucleoside-triphosphate reductase activating protein